MGSEEDIKRRVNLSRQVIQSLTNVWKSRYISKQTKIRVYETLVLSVLLYNSETWVLKESDKRVLLAFEMMCLRRIEGISKRDRKRNLDIRKGLGMQTGVVNRIQQRRLRYFGHVARMNCDRYPQIAMPGRVQVTRGRGDQKNNGWMSFPRITWNLWSPYRRQRTSQLSRMPGGVSLVECQSRFYPCNGIKYK